jgi:hypothetical protein
MAPEGTGTARLALTDRHGAPRTSIAPQSDGSLGGPLSILVRQKRDHVELGQLLEQLGRTQGGAQGGVHRGHFPAEVREQVAAGHDAAAVPRGALAVGRKRAATGGDRVLRDHVLVLAGDAGVPPLQQVLHHHGHLAELATDELLELGGERGVRLLGLGRELQLLHVLVHRWLLCVVSAEWVVRDRPSAGGRHLAGPACGRP